MYLLRGLGRHIFGGMSMMYKEVHVFFQTGYRPPFNSHSICGVVALRRVHPSNVVCVTLLEDNVVVVSACGVLVRRVVANVVPSIGRTKSAELNTTPGGNHCVVAS